MISSCFPFFFTKTSNNHPVWIDHCSIQVFWQTVFFHSHHIFHWYLTSFCSWVQQSCGTNHLTQIFADSNIWNKSFFPDLEFIKFDLDLICMLCWFDLDLIWKPADLICDLKKKANQLQFFSNLETCFFLTLKPREWTNHHVTLLGNVIAFYIDN